MQPLGGGVSKRVGDSGLSSRSQHSSIHITLRIRSLCAIAPVTKLQTTSKKKKATFDVELLESFKNERVRHLADVANFHLDAFGPTRSTGNK